MSQAVRCGPRAVAVAQSILPSPEASLRAKAKQLLAQGVSFRPVKGEELRAPFGSDTRVVSLKLPSEGPKVYDGFQFSLLVEAGKMSEPASIGFDSRFFIVRTGGFANITEVAGPFPKSS
jgi:hypothetical protein